IVLVGVGLWIRLGILETPVFTRLLQEKRTSAAPVAEVLRKNWREVILTCLLRTGQQAPFYIFWTYVLVYATGTLQMQRQDVLNDTLIASGVSLFTVPLWGYLSDRFGRRRTYMFGALAMALFAWPYFALLDTRVPGLVLLAIVLAPVVHDIQYGPQAAFIAEAFPPRLRYSGASLGYHLASVTAGGPAPIIAAYLLAQFGTSLAIVAYIIVCALISLWSAAVLRDRTTADIDVEDVSETVSGSAVARA
ncbi:MAG: MFS transporter, partial [Chloroflexi bacterium]|nr:MFS transporter [Chloroflexota bacterium]